MKNGMSVKKLVVVLVLAMGCSRESAERTATIEPADPRPAPTPTETLGDGRQVTTSGSPIPASATAPGMELMTIRDTGITTRPLLPRGQTVFRIENDTGRPHQLELRTPGGDMHARTMVPVGAEAVLQARLDAPSYELVCVTPGHDERTRFDTYVAGTVLQLEP